MTSRENDSPPHKARVFAIHDQYPGSHPPNATRACHNERQAGVFDEQARCVFSPKKVTIEGKTA